MNLMIKIFPYKNVGIIYKSDTGRESVLYYNQGSPEQGRSGFRRGGISKFQMCNSTLKRDKLPPLISNINLWE